MTTVRFSVKHPDGAPVPNAIVDIQLPQAGIDSLGDTLVLPVAVKETTNTLGELTVDLAPITTIPYKAVVYDANKNRKGVYEFFVPNAEGIINVADLVLLPKPSGVNYDAAAIADITNERILAQQAADVAKNGNSPRYRIIEMAFYNSGGNQVSDIELGHENAFFIVDEDEGKILVPEDEDMPFEIGTAFVFIKGDTYPEIDVSFEGATGNVQIEALSVTGTKLQYATDVVNLVKVDTNTWKLFNLAEGGSAGANEQDFINIYLKFDNVQSQIAALEGWRTAFNTRLNALELTTGNNTASIAAINNSLASLSSVIAQINTTIDQKINAAVPGLGDITAYVDDAEAAQAAADASATAASNSENAAFASASNASVSEINAANSEAAINAAIGEAGYVVHNLAALKALDHDEITSAFMEGVNDSNDPVGSAKRYFYSDVSLAASDDIYVVRPDDIVDDLTPGRWLHIPIGDDQFLDETLTGSKIAKETLEGSANVVAGQSLFVPNSIGQEDLGVGSVGSPELQNESVTLEKLEATARMHKAPSWMYNFGAGNSNLTVAGYTAIGSGIYFYNNITITGILGHVGKGQLILVARGTFRMQGTGSIRANGKGGQGGDKSSNNAEGGVYYLGGGGGGGYATDGIGQPGGGTYWNTGGALAGQVGTTAEGKFHRRLEVINAWNPLYRGGAGGGGHSGGADSKGGNGGGIVIVIARNFDFRAGTFISCNGDINDSGGDVDLHDAGCGGGGVIITAALNTINNSGSRNVSGGVPAGYGNVDTVVGGNGFSLHFNL